MRKVASVVGRVLLVDLVAGLGLDPCLLRVVDTARQIAVGSNDGRGDQPSAEAGHLGSFQGIEGSATAEWAVSPPVEVSEPRPRLSNAAARAVRREEISDRRGG